MLRQVGAVITASVRETDVHGRLGGEEFAILLPHTKLDVALSIAQELIQAIARLEAEPAERITASLGLASLDYTDESIYTLMNNADRALYKAKSYGRNQVAVAE
ncbi:diguanylate cyclase [Pseudomonas sp. St29]|nr:diguanylate cyclase [Pseudomonas sp. St29]